MDTIAILGVLIIIAAELTILYRLIPYLMRQFQVAVATLAVAARPAAPPRPTVMAAQQNYIHAQASSPQPTQAAKVVMPPPPMPSQTATQPTPVIVPPPAQPPQVQPIQPPPATMRPTATQPATPAGPVHKPADYDDYYDVLAVLPDSNEAEIKAAYRSLIKLWHTDVCKAPDAQVQMNAITEAYEVLSDPDQRKLYDEGLKLQEDT